MSLEDNINEYLKQYAVVKEIKEKLDEQGKEIERLTKQNKALNEMYELTKKEYIRLNNIIKEVREYIKHTQNYGREKVIYVNGNDILEILDKEKV